MSVGPPAANGTTMRIGRKGPSCAKAICETSESAATPAARCTNFRRGRFICVPPSDSAQDAPQGNNERNDEKLEPADGMSAAAEIRRLRHVLVGSSAIKLPQFYRCMRCGEDVA